MARFPQLGGAIARLELARLPTPVRRASLRLANGEHALWIKADDATSEHYGGNKVRKLEYLLGRALRKQTERVATFGATGSNHALATAIFARVSGLKPTCFLSHQTRTPLAADALHAHLELGTELIEFGGTYANRLKTLRKSLWDTHADVIPLGGSSWVGTVGFVTAGLELADQIRAHQLPEPRRIYLASGTLGSAAGLGLGLAAASLATEVHAIRVSHHSIANSAVLRRLLSKTTHMLHRALRGVPIRSRRARPDRVAQWLFRARLRARQFSDGRGNCLRQPATRTDLGADVYRQSYGGADRRLALERACRTGVVLEYLQFGAATRSASAAAGREPTSQGFPKLPRLKRRLPRQAARFAGVRILRLHRGAPFSCALLPRASHRAIHSFGVSATPLPASTPRSSTSSSGASRIARTSASVGTSGSGSTVLRTMRARS